MNIKYAIKKYSFSKKNALLALAFLFLLSMLPHPFLACVQQMHSSRFSLLGLIPQCFDCHKRNISWFSSIWQPTLHFNLVSFLPVCKPHAKLKVAMRLKCAKFKLNQGFWILTKILLSDSNFVEGYSLLILMGAFTHLVSFCVFCIALQFFINHLNWWKPR